jgi:hypothetical protein
MASLFDALFLHLGGVIKQGNLWQLSRSSTLCGR